MAAVSVRKANLPFERATIDQIHEEAFNAVHVPMLVKYLTEHGKSEDEAPAAWFAPEGNC
jgi:hypothetical protein